MKVCPNRHWKKKNHEEDHVSAGFQATDKRTSYLWPCVTSEQIRQRITWKQEVKIYAICNHVLMQ